MKVFQLIVFAVTILSLSFRFQSVYGFDEGVKTTFKQGHQQYFFHVQTNFKSELTNELQKTAENLKKEILKELKQEFLSLKQSNEAIMQELKLQRHEIEAFRKENSAILKQMQPELTLQRHDFEKILKTNTAKLDNTFAEIKKLQQNAEDNKNCAQQNKIYTENISPNLLKLENGQNTLKAYAAEVLNGHPTPDHWNENFNCTKNCHLAAPIPSSCEEAMKICHNNAVYLLKIPNSGLPAFYANCKCINNQIWTVIQRREDGSVDFYKDWLDYKLGFGNLNGEMWFGLERMHQMTKRKPHEIQIWLTANNGTEYFARYKKFEIADEADKYRVTVRDYSGSAGDMFGHYHDGMQFSTRDNCNEVDKGCDKDQCAVSYRGAWWFHRCYGSHLNGLYSDSSNGKGIDWHLVSPNLKYSQMAIRQL